MDLSTVCKYSTASDIFCHLEVKYLLLVFNLHLSKNVEGITHCKRLFHETFIGSKYSGVIYLLSDAG